MQLPFHGLQVCGDVFFAAKGANIHSFSTSGTHISCWKYPVDVTAENNGQAQGAKPLTAQNEIDEEDDNDGPPAKRVKLENGAADADADVEAEAKPAEVKGDEAESKKKGKKQRGRGQQGRSNIPRPPDRSMVILMATTKNDNASHLVAVTSDKSIWVFEHDGRGGLTQLSRRTMPKRPCSIVLTPDNKDILSADKFGDVYSLPLLPNSDPTATEPAPASTTETVIPPAAAAAEPTAASPDPTTAEPSGTEPTTTTTNSAPYFVSQATALTVHTQRNLKALNNQLVSATNPKAWRGTPKRVLETFERHLLLGHVSLLTAITLGHDALHRPYLLTADRDEHIRVSRGTRAQAHVVERFCMGHEQFVNRLLVAGKGGELLLSGGGDGEVFVWRWLEGTLLARVDLLGRVREVVPGVEKIAVTGLSLWPAGEGEETRVVVFCERVPAIFLFSLKDSGVLEFSRTISLCGNPFEAGVQDDKKLIVAVDPTHKEAGEERVKKSLLRVECVNGEYQISDELLKNVGIVDANLFSNDDVPADEYDRMLYSAETLRKVVFDEDRGGADETREEFEVKDEPMGEAGS